MYSELKKRYVSLKEGGAMGTVRRQDIYYFEMNGNEVQLPPAHPSFTPPYLDRVIANPGTNKAYLCIRVNDQQKVQQVQQIIQQATPQNLRRRLIETFGISLDGNHDVLVVESVAGFYGAFTYNPQSYQGQQHLKHPTEVEKEQAAHRAAQQAAMAAEQAERARMAQQQMEAVKGLMSLGLETSALIDTKAGPGAAAAGVGGPIEFEPLSDITAILEFAWKYRKSVISGDPNAREDTTGTVVDPVVYGVGIGTIPSADGSYGIEYYIRFRHAVAELMKLSADHIPVDLKDGQGTTALAFLTGRGIQVSPHQVSTRHIAALTIMVFLYHDYPLPNGLILSVAQPFFQFPYTKDVKQRVLPDGRVQRQDDSAGSVLHDDGQIQLPPDGRLALPDGRMQLPDGRTTYS